MKKHEKEKAKPSGQREFKFKKGALQAKQTQYEGLFGRPFKHSVFLAFDFECLLEKENIHVKKEHYIQKHVPIGVVCKVWGNKQIDDFRYVGLDVADKLIHYLQKIHNKLRDQKIKEFYKLHAKELLKIEEIHIFQAGYTYIRFLC